MLETDVNLREKIIAGLAACLPRTKAEARMGCKECPYHGGACEEYVEMPIEIAEDMRALLKALEPRLMTFEEAVCAEVMYYEQRYVHHGITKGHSVFPVIRCVDVFSRRVEWYSPYFPEGRTSLLFTPDEYGMLGRCWTSRPTDKQRKAVGWAHVT